MEREETPGRSNTEEVDRRKMDMSKLVAVFSYGGSGIQGSFDELKRTYPGLDIEDAKMQ